MVYYNIFLSGGGGNQKSLKGGSPRRLAWPRTPAFHAGNAGSNPAGGAIFYFEFKYYMKKAGSSVGRAPPLQGGGRGFESRPAYHLNYF